MSDNLRPTDPVDALIWKAQHMDQDILHVRKDQLLAVADLKVKVYTAFRAGYNAGWAASHEGCNGETVRTTEDFYKEGGPHDQAIDAALAIWAAS